MLLIKKTILFNAILLLLVLSAKAQSYYFRHYQVEDGLAHNTVITVLQDKKGFMWVGTKGGLNRFDGYTFKSFKNNRNRFGDIGNNVIIALCEDARGMIWVGTMKGIFKYDPYKETFKELKLPPSFTSNILVDGNNDLWFLSDSRLIKYDQKRNQLTRFNLMASCISFDQSGNIWLGTTDGIIKKYDPQKKTVRSIQVIGDNVPANLKTISKLLFTPHHQLLIGTTKQGLKCYDLKTGQIVSLLMQNKDKTEIYVRDILETGREEYWIATESGIYVYNLKTNRAKNLRKHIGDNYSLSDNAVYCLAKDNRKGIWAGTFFGGLDYLSKETVKFEKYYPSSAANSMSGNAAREICSDQLGNIWIGTEDAGINKLDIKTGKFSNYTSDGSAGSISYPNIHGMLAIGDKLYMGPFQHGLEILDIKTGKVTDRYNLIGAKDKQNSDFVMCIFLTSDSTILIGTSGAGLFIFNPGTKRFKRVDEVPENGRVYSILEDHEGTIWIGSLERGVFYFNPKTGKKGNISFKNTAIGESKDYLIQGLCEDTQHVIWLATEGGGLIKLSADRKTIKKFTTENGLPSNNLFRILEDHSGNLWISSLKGLICLTIKTEKFKVYTEANGLITNQFNYNSAFKDTHGKMYFGSVKGVVAFHPEEMGKPLPPPPTYITGFQVNNKEVSPDRESSPLKNSVLYADTVVLKHDQSNFNIEFSALSFASPSVTRYAYFMKGLDKDWTYLNSNRKAYFTDLSAGDYTFIVKAESNVGSWKGKERKLFVTILPPVWQSYGAYTAYLLIFIIALYLSIRYYHRYLEKKNLNRLQLFELEKEKEIYQAKIEFFTNIAHEIQTPLTLIIGPVERVMKKIEELPSIKSSLLMIKKNSTRLLDLTDQLLDFRKTEMNEFGLNFVNTDISALLKEQVNIFRQEAEKRKISLTLNLPKNHLIAFVDMEALVKITGNLISNAIKYADSKILISLFTSTGNAEEFLIRFSNDGKPIPAEFREKIFEPFFRVRGNDKPGTGIGLSLAISLTELHNGSLKLNPEETGLIDFDLILPVHQKIEFNLSKWKNMN